MGKYRTPSESNQYYLPKHTYLACVHYALQYRDLKAILDSERDSRGAIRYDKDRVQTTHDYDSTSEIAMRMVEIQKKVDLIDSIIAEVCEDSMNIIRHEMTMAYGNYKNKKTNEYEEED